MPLTPNSHSKNVLTPQGAQIVSRELIAVDLRVLPSGSQDRSMRRPDLHATPGVAAGLARTA